MMLECINPECEWTTSIVKTVYITPEEEALFDAGEQITVQITCPICDANMVVVSG